jgi:ABC-2 type transport system ATP-binding protein
MRQRLGIAAALLGDPGVLLFDEPINGLDLDGVLWVRSLLRRLADEGRTVLVSSHLMSEMQQTADRLVVVGRGRLIADATTAEIVRGLGQASVRVRSDASDVLLVRLQAAGFTVRRADVDELHVEGGDAGAVGEVASRAGLPLRHLSEVEQSLEQAYLELTSSSVEYAGSAPEPVAASAGSGR